MGNNEKTFTNEALRLWNLGFGIHWLKPHSKAPVKPGWNGPVRDDLDQLDKDYRKENGIGVRLGEPSKLNDGAFLAVIDVDLKSPDPRHQAEAFAVVDLHFPDLRLKCPVVRTGRGYHFYVKTNEPVKSGKISSSKDEVECYAPTSEVNRRQRSKLSEKKLSEGIRIKNAWEVEFMSVGKQVVLPPTLHPDLKKPYVWEREIIGLKAIPLVSYVGGKKQTHTDTALTPELKLVEVDALDLEMRLSPKICAMIFSGTDDNLDQSAALYSVCLAMARARFTAEEITGTVMSSDYSLIEIAFNHRKTQDRNNASDWVYRYNALPALREVSAAKAFEEEVEITPLLSDDEAITQALELLEIPDWQMRLQRNKDGDGPPKATLENIVLILTMAVGVNVFVRDEFESRDLYGCAAPWGGEVGEVVGNDDIAQIIFWLGNKFRVEPSEGTIHNAITVIATDNAYHPVRDQLDALPAWDGVARLDSWLIKNFQAEGDPEYLAQVFRKWMVAAVTRIYRPGTKFDWMMILEGAQGIGKSSFGRLMVGERHFTDSLTSLADKDSALALQGRWVVEMSELATLRKNELELIKGFITRMVDKVRPPYGRRVVEIPRQCVFFGTTNHEEYLRDDTGNRRFKPVKVGQLDFEMLACDRDQLWAEALFIFNERLETTLDLEGHAKVVEQEVQKSKMVKTEADILFEILGDFFEQQEKQKDDENNGEFSPRINTSKFKVTELFSRRGVHSGPIDGWHLTPRNVAFASQALKRLGFIKMKMHGGNWWKRAFVDRSSIGQNATYRRKS